MLTEVRATRDGQLETGAGGRLTPLDLWLSQLRALDPLAPTAPFDRPNARCSCW